MCCRNFAIITLLCWARVVCLLAQESDTLKSVEVKELEIKAKRWVRPAESAVPYESLSQQELARSAANTLADAVRQLPSVMLKDYGGIGGLKTISVRSLALSIPVCNSTASSCRIRKRGKLT